jgi:ribosomal-protein-alanine N-acetyltransferase
MTTRGTSVYYFIEPMVEEDIEAVQQVEMACYHGHWSAATYQRELESSETCRYVIARASHTAPPPHESPQYGLHQCGSMIRMLMDRFFHRHSGAIFAPKPPVIGYAGLWLGVDEGHITTIAVEPRSRGFGVGELLLNGLIDETAEMNAHVLTLEVRVSNIVAQSLYRKYGFTTVGERRRYYTDTGEDALIMTTPPLDDPEYQNLLRDLQWQLFSRLRAEAQGDYLLVTPAMAAPSSSLSSSVPPSDCLSH